MKEELEDIVIGKAMKGDYNAYRYIVDKYKSYVFNISYRVLKNREDAEESAQDCFVKVFKSIRDFKYESKFSTWLYRIAFNHAISRTRKKVLETENIDYSGEMKNVSDITSGLENMNNRERAEYLKKAIEMLTSEEAILINLYYWQDCSMSEVAAVTGLDENSVKVKIHRSRHKLYKNLSESLGIKIEDII